MNQSAAGSLDGLIGVAIFCGSLPATRLAVMDLALDFLTGLVRSLIVWQKLVVTIAKDQLGSE